MSLRMFCALALAAALALGGCNKAKDKLAEKVAEAAMEKAMEKEGGKADIDLANQKFSMETRDGQKMEFAGGAEGIKIPEDFPKEVFIYPGATATGSMKEQDNQTLLLTAGEPVAKIAAAYKEKMTAGGWKEASNNTTAEMTMTQYTLGKRMVMVHITADGEKKSQIMLMVQPNPDTEKEEPTKEEKQ